MNPDEQPPLDPPIEVQEDAPEEPVRPPRVNRPRVLPTPPKPAVPDKNAGKIVHVNCRAGNGGCGSQQVEIRSITKIPTGGRAIRYRCLKCHKIFQTNC